MKKSDNEREAQSPRTVHLTEVEVAKLLNISRRTLQGWRLRGEGPSFEKFGRLVRYNRSVLDAWIGGQQRSSTSDAGPNCYGGTHRLDNPSQIGGGQS